MSKYKTPSFLYSDTESIDTVNMLDSKFTTSRATQFIFPLFRYPWYPPREQGRKGVTFIRLFRL
jgi:hypothetical protein